MSTPNGYNNPAFCHQYDSSLYDYQYVPEIDPDSPDLEEFKKKGNHTKLVPNFSESDEFEGSDESNGSIIIEECNNRRVTLICVKRNKQEMDKIEYYEDGQGAYYQDISLESENGCLEKSSYSTRSLRHQKPLQPPTENTVRSEDRRCAPNPNLNQSTISVKNYSRPQRYHRYEEIPSEEEYHRSEPPKPASIHRYAEISSDENGYPTLTKEIKIEQNSDRYRQKENYPQKIASTPSKPTAVSPVNYPKSFSPPQTPSRTYQRGYIYDSPSPNSPSLFIYSSSPLKTNSFEMSELSPPRTENLRMDQTFFINSPKRQPPIGASIPESQEHSLINKCILPKNLQQFSAKSSRERSHSFPNSPRKDLESSPSRIYSDKKISQIFHIKQTKPNVKVKSRGNTPNEKDFAARRNISNSFTDPPSQLSPRSPYKPTTVEVNPARTAVITPIFSRKNPDLSFSPKRNFEKMSQAFQSTGNIFRGTKESYQSSVALQSSLSPGRMKRNQSVPNFSQSLGAETRLKNQEIIYQENQKFSPNLDFQYSPKKQLSPIEKSRISLIDHTRSSWSNSESDYLPHCSMCFILAAVVHLVTATATCAISFYLLSKIGRRYYLDFGLLAGCVNFILGLLGFRSYCWRWLPHRNYVSGFIGLAAFSAFTCAGLTYLITARPMAGDPILDIMGGAICAVSVLTIVLALTGLTMSGCCKAPPPDNRVTNI